MDEEREVNHEGDRHGQKSKALNTLAEEEEGSDGTSLVPSSLTSRLPTSGVFLIPPPLQRSLSHPH
ncbi:hypothetical protein HYDPIDRAFT_116127 [Hydnomerulius pinastri MD-312]|uniref:Uncharacterized protein n=1 Tax=Hydnomerulius pinastri MD-312 TaxID=994086 RepID=A0A0C9W493_9AGAM|nr:hypothetical protein HYDPIDRAFT_116127 [Hydnomerulius pinastri MD-312]